MAICHLEGHGECSGSLSREHYISASLLRQLNCDKGFKIGGLSWQPPQQMQAIGIGSLQSKILCQTHNSQLSPLDAVSSDLFRTLNAVDKHRSSVPQLSRFDGPSVERWLLKVLFGLSASGSVKAPKPPDLWKALLVGAEWPELWGLYVFPQPGVQIFTTDLLIEIRTHPQTGAILAGQFRIAGVTFFLLLGKPDEPSAFGIHRPRGLIFHHGEEERRIEFIWPFHTEAAVIFTSAGPPTSIRPPHHEGWKE
jgi:hypothetical protein